MGSTPSKPSEIPSSQSPAAPSMSVGTPAPVENSPLSSPSPTVPTIEESNAKSGCPMHNSDGTYRYDWWKVLSGDFMTQHGPSGKQPLSKEEAELKTTTKESIQETKVASSTGATGGCPVRHSSSAPPMSSSVPLSASLSASSGGGCPVKHASRSSPQPQYNVYGQPMDPANNMPYNPNQLPSYNQTIPLSTHRVASTIPKGGGQPDNDDIDTKENVTTWLYPSPQMFYNALQRKNKLTDDSGMNSSGDGDDKEQPTMLLQPQDIESVVAIHNNMNEKTWYKILQWESIVHDKPIHEIEPKLLKFQGRPMDLSPKAAMKYYLFGHPLPYDRHDWIVERNGGASTQRYVIDYYYDVSLGRTDPESALPDLQDRHTGSPSLLVDVRPALDSVSALYHRAIIMPYAQYRNTATNSSNNGTTIASEMSNGNDPRRETYEYLPLWPSSTMKSQVNESIQVWQEIRKNSYASTSSTPSEKREKEEISAKREQLNQTVQDELTNQFQQAMKRCQKEQSRMNLACANVTDDHEGDKNGECHAKCAKASIDLTLCMGSILCPIQHAAFRKTVQQQNDSDDSTMMDDALTRLQDCLKYKSQQYQQINETIK